MTSDEKIELIYEKVQQIERHLNGNGRPSDGVLMRLDRIEQREITRERHEDWRMRAFWGSVFSAVIASVVAVIGWMKN